MGHISELFWNATLDELKQGYIYNSFTEEYTCLVCGQSFVKGVIYPEDGILYDAQKYVKIHISKDHGSMFNYLLNMDKKLTGLTEHQKSLVQLFYEGHSDAYIAKELQMGSTSTVRNHRFSLREKQKQAKIFLALMELMQQESPKQHKFIDIPLSSKMVDERFAITEEENESILKMYFKEGPDGPLDKFPLKQKRKVAVLRHIIKRFDTNKHYTEKEVNEILANVYHDYVTLRRYLIEYGFVDRTPDGSSYWVKV